MTIKLHDLERWTALPRGRAIDLPAKTNRRVRLHINVPLAVNLTAVLATGEVRFLAALERGVNVVEFTTRGGVVVHIDGDVECFFHVAEGEATTIKVKDPKIFTRIAQRRPRNPELEAMMYVAQQNMEKRFAAMARDHDRQMAALAKERKGDDEKPGVHVGKAAEPQKSDGAKGGAGKAARPSGGVRPKDTSAGQSGGPKDGGDGNLEPVEGEEA